MTSIEWGISISNQRWGEREREWGAERERGRQKEGHSLASDESERGGNILKGSRASKSERKAEWRRQRRKEELRKETMWSSIFFSWKLAKAQGAVTGIFLMFIRWQPTTLSPIVFSSSSPLLPVVYSHFYLRFRCLAFHGLSLFSTTPCTSYTIPKSFDGVFGHSEHTYA